MPRTLTLDALVDEADVLEAGIASEDDRSKKRSYRRCAVEVLGADGTWTEYPSQVCVVTLNHLILNFELNNISSPLYSFGVLF